MSAPCFRVAVTVHVGPFREETFSTVDLQREEEITVVCAAGGAEWDSKIANRPSKSCWMKDGVQHCSAETNISSPRKSGRRLRAREA